MDKFDEFYEMLREYKSTKDKPDSIMVHNPNVLGDNYEEIIDNLNRVSDVGAKLMIVPSSER